MTEISFCFTVDTDADEYFGNLHPIRAAGDKTIVGFRGFEKGKNLICQACNRIRDSFGNRLPITWFVRCDRQIEATFGEKAYLLGKFRNFWHYRLNEGDEIQWHAHLYRKTKNGWCQETDIKEISDDLSKGLYEFSKFESSPQIIRIGESYHSDELMETLEQMGILADSSAIPGRIRKDDEKSIDWGVSPNHPYSPSVADYRVPGNPRRILWEIPLNTVKTRVSYDSFPILRYVNPSFQLGVLNEGIAEFLGTHSILVSITHPFEIIPDFFSDRSLDVHPLLSFNIESIEENLRMIVQTAESKGRSIRFITMSSLLQHLVESYGCPHYRMRT